MNRGYVMEAVRASVQGSVCWLNGRIARKKFMRIDFQRNVTPRNELSKRG